MTHIETAAETYRQPFRGSGNHISSMDIKKSFEEGAEYMLEKVCEWLKKYGDDFGVPESESGRVYVDDLVCEIRKAMEE